MNNGERRGERGRRRGDGGSSATAGYSVVSLRVGWPAGVAALALLALIVAAVVSLVVIPNGSNSTRGDSPGATSVSPGTDSPGLAGPASDDTAGVLPWMNRVIPLDARIVTDSTFGRVLSTSGFNSVAAPGSSASTGIEQAEYLVETKQVRTAASTDPMIRRVRDWSVPVAMFGSAADRVVVRKISPVRPNVLAARRAADSRARVKAERQLLANPAVRADGTAADALRRGELDLRSATVLVIVASSNALDLEQVIADKAETAAGLPAHEVVVRTTPVDGVQSVLQALPPSYRPIRTRELAGGSTRITWAIDPDTFAADSP